MGTIIIITDRLAKKLGAYIPRLAKPAIQLVSTEDGVDEIQVGVAEAEGKICSFSPLGIENLDPEILYSIMSQKQRNKIYDLERKKHVREDTRGVIQEKQDKEELLLSDDEAEQLADAVSRAYVEDGDYNCELSYWDNIDNLIDKFN